jgi:hypothetical protein
MSRLEPWLESSLRSEQAATVNLASTILELLRGELLVLLGGPDGLCLSIVLSYNLTPRVDYLTLYLPWISR